MGTTRLLHQEARELGRALLAEQSRVGFDETHDPLVQPAMQETARLWLAKWAGMLRESPESAVGPLASLLAEVYEVTSALRPDVKSLDEKLDAQRECALEAAALVVDKEASIRRMRAQAFTDDTDRADGEAQVDDIEREEQSAELLEYVATRIRALRGRAAAKPEGGT